MDVPNSWLSSRSLLVLLLSVLVWPPAAAAALPADPRATREARVLFHKLHSISSLQAKRQASSPLLGQQNAFTEGRGWRLDNRDLPGNPRELPHSDLELVTGTLPAISGWDLLEMHESNRALYLQQMRAYHQRGGVITISWHMESLIDDGIGDGSAWDPSGRDVSAIMRDPWVRARYLERLDRLVAFLTELGPVPVIYRPFHEHNGNWFWWGTPHCTAEEFKALWRLTVSYLRSRGIHQLLIGWSPDTFGPDYMERYPGDEWVDLMGIDMYFKDPTETPHTRKRLDAWRTEVLDFLELVRGHDKIAAITEFGSEGVRYPSFWTRYLEPSLSRRGVLDWSAKQNRPAPSWGLAYVLLWRNDSSSATHFFGPAPGGADVPDFLAMIASGSFRLLPPGGFWSRLIEPSWLRGSRGPDILLQ